MDLAPEQLQDLTITEAIEESVSIPKSSPKTFSLIILTLIFPFSLAFLAPSHFTHPLLKQIENQFPTNPKLLQEWTRLLFFQFCYLIFLFAFSLPSTAAVVFIKRKRSRKLNLPCMAIQRRTNCEQQQIQHSRGREAEEDRSNSVNQPLYGDRYFCEQKIMCGGTTYKMRGIFRAGNLNPACLPPESSSPLPSIYYENQMIMVGGERPPGEFDNDGILELGNMG